MEAYRVVTVVFLWMLPLGLNVAVTVLPNQHSTNFRGSELTTPSDKHTSALKVTKESLTNAPKVGHRSTVVELQPTKKNEQNSSQVSTKHAVSSSSMHPRNMRTRRKAEENQDRQETTKKDNSSMAMTTKTARTASTSGIQPDNRSAALTSKSQVRPTASSQSVPLEMTTKTSASTQKTQTPNQPARIQTEPASSKSNSSTDMTRETSEVTLTTDDSSTRGKTQPPGTHTQYPVTTRISASSKPTERVLTSTTPTATTPPSTTPSPTSALTETTARRFSQALSEPAKNNATTAANVTASIVVTSTRGPSTPTNPITKPVAALTTTGRRAETLLPTDKKNSIGNHGTVVAVLIGGTLGLMMIGILVILVRKRKWQKTQLQNQSWAGPSPFLDGGFQTRLEQDDSRASRLRGSNRISFSGFLSQRLSKRMSLLPEADDQIHLDDIPVGLTFGRESALDNGTAAVDEDQTQNEETQPLGSSSSPSQSASSGTNTTEPTNEPPPYISSSLPPSGSSGTTAISPADEPSAPLQAVDLKPDNALHPSPLPPDSPKTVPHSFLEVDLSPPSEQTSPPPPENPDLPSPPDAP